jgi:hypothetical protein
VSTALELVFQYRQLAGKCEAVGLTMDEIEMLQTVEALFADHDRAAGGRQFSREPVNVSARLRARGRIDQVKIQDLAPGGLVCDDAPYLDKDETVEIVVSDEELSLSYRFKAKVSWRRDQPDGDYRVGLRFIGTPLVLRYASAAAKSVANAA